MAALALSALLLPAAVVGLGAGAVLVAALLDARAARRRPTLERRVARVLSRGVPASFEAAVDAPGAAAIRLRQAAPPEVRVQPAEAAGRIEGRVVAGRRGRHALPGLAARVAGPLGLGAAHHRSEATEVLVYPDIPSARRLAFAVRTGRFQEQGRLTRGPLGLGTDFESVRDYLPDDDFRQLNWRATARLGRAMSNQYRVEQDRDVTCVVDTGRLMAAPLPGDRTRLDAALDACVAVALVADELGDRAGALAFDAEVRRRLAPRRRGGDAVVRALFDLEPRGLDSDYELAFQTVESAKRSLVVVFTDVLEEAAAGPLVEAIPVLARRHAVVVASVADPDLEAMLTNPPEDPLQVYAQAAALDVLGARARVAARLRHSGATVVEQPPDRLAAACVRAYLSAKARARL